MREDPGLGIDKISACLDAHYGPGVASVSFLPIGYDPGAAVYRVIADDGISYFLMVRFGTVHEPSLLVPRALLDLGVRNVFRYVLAGLLLLAFLRLLPGWGGVRLGRGDLLTLAALGFVGIAINYVGYTVGLSLTSGSNAALIIATAPVWGLLLGVVLGLERGSWMGALGLGLAISGVALVVGGGLGSAGASVGGDLLVCVSALSWGAYTVLALPVLRRLDPLWPWAPGRCCSAASRPFPWPSPGFQASRNLSLPWSGAP